MNAYGIYIKIPHKRKTKCLIEWYALTSFRPPVRMIRTCGTLGRSLTAGSHFFRTQNNRIRDKFHERRDFCLYHTHGWYPGVRFVTIFIFSFFLVLRNARFLWRLVPLFLLDIEKIELFFFACCRAPCLFRFARYKRLLVDDDEVASLLALADNLSDDEENGNNNNGINDDHDNTNNNTDDSGEASPDSVSYTHLTLPTICSV